MDNYCYEFTKIYQTGKFRDNSPKYWWHDEKGLYEFRKNLADTFSGDARRATVILQSWLDGSLISYWCGETAVMEYEYDLDVAKYFYSNGTQGGFNTSPYFRFEDEEEPDPIEPHFMCIDQNEEKDSLIVRNYRIKDQVLEQNGCQSHEF